METSSSCDNESYATSASTYEEVEERLRDYEIKNIVRFACTKADKNFNAGAEPWRDFQGTHTAPKLLWGSDLVPGSEIPYIAVGRKAYQCQYGKQRHSKVTNKNTSVVSYKIGCPCTVEFVEVLRMTYPKIRKGPNGEMTKHHKRELAIRYKENIAKFKLGHKHDLRFKREFHLHISPLSSHVHVTGKGAAEHQRIDTKLSERIHKLAASGITASDVIQDHLRHYVEEELFKDKELPLRTNRRFYPSLRDILNHTYLGRTAKKKNKKIPLSESDLAVTSITDGGVIYHDNGEPVEVGRYESVEQYEPPQEPQEFEQSSMYFPNSDFSQYSATNQNQDYTDVPSISSITMATVQKVMPNSKATGMTTRARKGTKRSPKERFIALVKKLYRIANALDPNHDMAKLTASLINTIVLAKPMVPEDKMGVLYEEDARPYIYPKRIRTYKKKSPIPRKKRHPEINPDATQLPDRRALRTERKRKRDAEAKAKRDELAKLMADSEPSYMQGAKRGSVSQGPPPKVLIMSDLKKPAWTLSTPLTSKPGTRIMLASNNVESPRDTASSSQLLTDSKQPKVVSNSSNQSLIRIVRSPSSTSSLVVGASGTSLQSLGVVTKKTDLSPKVVHVNYNSILPKPSAASIDVVSSTATSCINKVVTSRGSLLGHIIFPSKSLGISSPTTASSIVSGIGVTNGRDAVIQSSGNTSTSEPTNNNNNIATTSGVSLLEDSNSVVRVTPSNNSLSASQILLYDNSKSSAPVTSISSSCVTAVPVLTSQASPATIDSSQTFIKHS